MPEVQEDIFTAIHAALWDALRSHDPLAKLVAVRNFADSLNEGFEYFTPNVDAPDLPEIAIVQGAYSFAPFTVSDPGVAITQSYPIVLTTGELNPRTLNKVKEATIDALLAKGATLGLGSRQVRSWGMAGNDAMTSQSQEAPGQDRGGSLRYESVGVVSVKFLKPLQNRIL